MIFPEFVATKEFFFVQCTVENKLMRFYIMPTFEEVRAFPFPTSVLQTQNIFE